MTEELQDGQQLSDGDKAAEKPAQDNPDQETEQKNVQLASSGPPEEEESKPDGSAPLEPVFNTGVTDASESVEPVKDAGKGPAANEEQGNQNESEEKMPEESNSSEGNTAGPNKEERGVSKDGKKQSEVQEGASVQHEETIAQKPTDEQQAEVKPERESEGPTKEENKEEQGAVGQGEDKPAQENESNEEKAQDHTENTEITIPTVPSSESENVSPQEASQSKALDNSESTEDSAKETAPDVTNPETENEIPQQETGQEKATEGTETTEDSPQKPSDKDETDGATKSDITPVEREDAKDNQTVQATIENDPTDVKQEEVSEEADKPVKNQEHIQSDAPSTEQQPAVTTTQIAAVPAGEAPQTKPGELQEENKKLKQDLFMMKQQEDAYRIKVLSLEQEVGKLRARKIDNKSQDSLASDSDSYLKQKLAETERDLDTAERKVKDLQLRLKRFAKDDQIKDEKIFHMEKEVKELSEHVKRLERSMEDSKTEKNNNATLQANPDKNDSRVCIIL